MAKHKCLSCEVVIDFEPVYCCSGRECGCKGLPIDPPLCGDCERELFKMAKINREEYEVLKELDDKWKWIARDGFTGIVNVYEDKPRKIGLIKEWTPTGDRANRTIFNKANFQFIQWEDESPYNIQELIEEYESEEKEVKDLEWLKRSIDKRIKTIESDDITFVGSEYYDEGYIDGMRDVLYRINQLDEPEVLSLEWISDNAVVGQYPDGMGYVVPAYKLQNLLVPKREVPVIPAFVADYIENEMEHEYPLEEYRLLQENPGNEAVADWAYENRREFYLACDIGYEIKQDPKYYAKIKGWENVTTGSERFNWVYFKEKDTVGISKAIENKYQAVSFTKHEWAKLGITDDNAEFELVEEVEE